MNPIEFDIIFRGDVVVGHQLQDVKQRMQQLFKTDATKIDALFTGRPVPLKRNLDEATANKYRDVLLKAGAQVEVRPSGELNPAAARPTAQPESASANQSKTALWTLAPVGSVLLAPTEKPKVIPVSVDTSAISLRPAGGNLLDATEVKPAPTSEVRAPNFEVAVLGADLIDSDEKTDLPLVEIEGMDWDLAEIGADLLSADEKPAPAAPLKNISDFGLAPAGSDLGQLKPQVKPVNPDISGIRLAD